MRFFSSPASGRHSGSTLSASQRAAGAHGCQPQLPQQAQHDQAQQAAHGQAAGGSCTGAWAGRWGWGAGLRVVGHGSGIIAAMNFMATPAGPAPFSLAQHRAHAARALSRGPPGPDGQQPDLHHHHLAGAVVHRVSGGVYRVSDVRQAAGHAAEVAGESLIPDTIARQVLGYLTQFAGKASRLGSVGLGCCL
jgi:hypothetical protein